MIRDWCGAAILRALCLALTVSAGCGKPAEEEVESETAVPVKAEPATLGDIRGLVHASGVVNPSPGADLVVVAPEAARIAEIPRAVGDRVRRGDLLVRFEVPTSDAEVRRQRAELARAHALLDNAKAARVRAQELFERGVAARREVEEAIRAGADADAAVAQAEASLASAQTVAARAVVRATFDGIVAKRLHNPGDLVEAAASDPVLRVIDPHRLEIVASVPLAEVSRVAVGAAARVTGGPIDPRDVALKVMATSAAVDTGTATVPVRLGPAGTLKVPIGTPAEVDIEAEHHSAALLVPAVAIVREGEETAVFVASDQKAQRRPVQTGLTDGAHVEILGGLKAGELVIVDGQAGLPDGAAITVGKVDQGSKPPSGPTASAKDAGK